MRRVLGLVLAVSLLGGCGLLGGDDGADTPTKVVDERGMRTDLGPLTARFAALGDPVSAQWQSGTLGDDRTAPGPSTYWIDAVVELDPQVADRLRLDAEPPTGVRPDLTPDVEEQVPAGRLARVTGVGHEGWETQAWLVEGTDTLVLSAHGQ